MVSIVEKCAWLTDLVQYPVLAFITHQHMENSSLQQLVTANCTTGCEV